LPLKKGKGGRERAPATKYPEGLFEGGRANPSGIKGGGHIFQRLNKKSPRKKGLLTFGVEGGNESIKKSVFRGEKLMKECGIGVGMRLRKIRSFGKEGEKPRAHLKSSQKKAGFFPEKGKKVLSGGRDFPSQFGNRANTNKGEINWFRKGRKGRE